jgi:hypothetical protein
VHGVPQHLRQHVRSEAIGWSPDDRP